MTKNYFRHSKIKDHPNPRQGGRRGVERAARLPSPFKGSEIVRRLILFSDVQQILAPDHVEPSYAKDHGGPQIYLSIAAWQLHFLFLYLTLLPMGPDVLGYQSHLVQRCHPACAHEGSSQLSPILAFRFFYRGAISAQIQLVSQWLSLTYSRFPPRKRRNKNTDF